MTDPFKEELQAAAEEAATAQLCSVKHALRQAFYAGVSFEIERRRAELKKESKPWTAPAVPEA